MEEKGWLKQILDSVKKETDKWPRWMVEGTEILRKENNGKV